MNIIGGIADLVFPPRCLICGEPLEWQASLSLCETCLKGITFISSPLCSRCGIPFSVREGDDHLCGGCLTEEKPYAVARSVGRYEGTILTAIHRFKYHGKTGIGKALGNIMADFASGLWEMGAFDMIIPVPLHIKKLKERGFNQAIILARPLSKRFRIPLEFSALTRVRLTPPQVGIGKKGRSLNVRGAFSVTNPKVISGRKILLIDDVYTTGSTLGECSRVLMDANAQAVAVLTMARTIGGETPEGEEK